MNICNEFGFAHTHKRGNQKCTSCHQLFAKCHLLHSQGPGPRGHACRRATPGGCRFPARLHQGGAESDPAANDYKQPRFSNSSSKIWGLVFKNRRALPLVSRILVLGASPVPRANSKRNVPGPRLPRIAPSFPTRF